MAITVTATWTLRIGEAGHVQGDAPEGPYSAVFEDDGDSGYFYALDARQSDQPIQDALHIYDVAQVADGHLPSEVAIGWSAGADHVVLLINDQPHAVFDFAARRGSCRGGFPPPAE
ncbi:DUF2251 domain-containing protein [Luteimonas sp. FCS-9]|uniref:DUF2251 domain-containing protein n=1 Tax=Luteimonas sp. FCS-9 TaxID=1547516 RepID=UPI00063EC9B8|nr:DUF2251 domain-containing protein [Luteimonas sp. FCS-9]KLI98311.1 hypothetical protein WQ56_15590 [Luteimonas sp. FCS-9]